MIQIKHKLTRAVLYECDAPTIKAAVEQAVREGVQLAGAHLIGAELTGAYLIGAKLAGAELAGVNLYHANLAGADLTGVNLYHANLAGAYLYHAKLAGAYLAGAGLTGAYLYHAYLAGASYGEGVPLTRAPTQLLGLRWPAIIMDAHIKIGCELHSTQEWESFDDARIVQMAGKEALKFWRENKDTILNLAATRQNNGERK